MKAVELSVMFRDGEVLVIREALPLDQCERFLSRDEEVHHEAHDEILNQIRQIEGWGSRVIQTLWMSVDESADVPAGYRVRHVSDAQSVWGGWRVLPKRRRLTSCRALLTFASHALPPTDRQEALDEWMDELECAVAENLPILRRTASILFRTCPHMAIRRRASKRMRGRG
ncbi:MAG TPA: hypothetical protein VFJ64_03210 [Solirubrobacterales bacterium]|nr:hypothetical protein [Solirubrobacterales bacterium]